MAVLWFPGLSNEGPRGDEARAFSEALEIIGEHCPFVGPVRLGLAALPARAPSRFYGGEEAVLDLLRDELGAFAERVGTAVRLGIADGLFAGVMAAREEVLVPPGCTPQFLAPFPVSVLRRAELAVLTQRLGLSTLGWFASLPEDRVLERFGNDGVHCHRVARGEIGDLEGIRDPRIGARLRCLHEVAPSTAQPSFFGGTSLADERAARAAIRLQQRFGPTMVQVARVRPGHDPADRAELVPFGSRPPELADTTAPWPGGLPAPSPTTVFSPPVPVRLTDPAGAPVEVSARGLLTAVPDRCIIAGESRQFGIVAWAGPWPLTTRWWDLRRARARLQVLTDAGVGLLLAAERGGWLLLGRYD